MQQHALAEVPGSRRLGANLQQFATQRRRRLVEDICPMSPYHLPGELLQRCYLFLRPHHPQPHPFWSVLFQPARLRRLRRLFVGSNRLSARPGHPPAWPVPWPRLPEPQAWRAARRALRVGG
eukprot:scaffold2140_cov394-Prasinococcus_capsulatus_cf.AAC.27